MLEIKDKVVVITGASSEIIHPPLAAATRLWAGWRGHGGIGEAT